MHELHELIRIGGPLSLVGAVIGGMLAYFNHDKEGGEHVVYGAIIGALVPFGIAALAIYAGF